jgi:hypothetical protein
LFCHKVTALIRTARAAGYVFKRRTSDILTKSCPDSDIRQRGMSPSEKSDTIQSLMFNLARVLAQLIVLNASGWGALTESIERLLPGRHLDVHVVTSGGRVLVRSRVVRAFVYHLQLSRGPRPIAVSRRHSGAGAYGRWRQAPERRTETVLGRVTTTDLRHR